MDYIKSIIIICTAIFYCSMYLSALKKEHYILGYLIAFYVGILFAMIGINKGEMLSISVLSAIVALTYLIREKKISINSTQNHFFIFLLISLMFFTMQGIISPAIGTDYFNQKYIFGMGLIYLPIILLLLFSKPLNHIEEMKIKEFFIFMGVFASVLLFLNIFSTGIDLSTGYMKRISLGSMSGIWLARFNIVALILLITHDKWAIVKRVLLFIFIFTPTLLTGSKILVYVLPIIILLLLTFSKNGALKKYLSIAVIAVSAYAVILSFNMTSNIALIRRFSLQSGTIHERIRILDIMKEGLTNISLFGNGLATVGELFVNTYERVYPHNLTLELLYEFGVFGLIIFLLPFIYGIIIMVVNIIRGIKQYDWLIWLFVAYLLFSFTSGDLISNQHVFIMVAVYICTISIHKTQPSIKRMHDSLLH